MSSVINYEGEAASRSLGTARWAETRDVRALTYSPGDFWLSRTIDVEETPIGYNDDRHALLVSGSRGGKGASIIVNNLCLWQGSAVVIDPKGENAIVTARRRAGGSKYCHGLGQKTYILDPFNTVHRDDDDFSDLKACFNPLDAIDLDGDEGLDEATRLADAIIVIQDKNDPFWEESARSLIRGLILHVVSDPSFEGQRNLISVRQLITRGDWLGIEALRAENSRRHDSGEEPIDEPNSFDLLWLAMSENEAFGNVVSGVGNSYASMSEKTRDGIIQVSNRNTEFIDSPGMRKSLEASDFSLAELKTDKSGVTVYLSLPQRYMNTHYRWLRMMITLTITEMEKVKQQPANGHRVLLVLDEFAGLKKMEIIENATAQIAGFGVKLFFIVQSLVQLKEIYKESWEVFLANAGLKLFFNVDDGFSRDYISKYLGESEVSRTTSSSSFSEGISNSISRSNSYGSSTSTSTAKSKNPNGSKTKTTTTTTGTSSTFNSSHSAGTSETTTTGSSQTLHKRPLITPDEIGRFFARNDNRSDAAYPGLAIAVASGSQPMVLRKANYFEDRDFRGLFDPHPDHAPPLKLPALKKLLIEEDAEAKRQREMQKKEDAERRRKESQAATQRYLTEQAALKRQKMIEGFRIAGIALSVILAIAFILYVPAILAHTYLMPDGFNWFEKNPAPFPWTNLTYVWNQFWHAIGAAIVIGIVLFFLIAWMDSKN